MDLGLGHHVLHLIPHAIIVSDVLHIPDNTERYRIVRAFHFDQSHVDADIVRMRIMNKNVFFSESALADMYDSYLLSVIYKTLVPVLSEYHLLSLAKDNGIVRLESRVRKVFVCTVVENDAIGEHFHNGTSVMKGSRRHNLFIEFQLHIQ